MVNSLCSINVQDSYSKWYYSEYVREEDINGEVLR